MMTSLSLQFPVQDENAGARPKGTRLPLGSHSRLKSFQDSNTNFTPRRALGNVKNILNQTPLNLKNVPLKPVGSNIKASLQKDVKSKRHVSFKSAKVIDKENLKKGTPQVTAPVLMKIENNQRILETDDVDHMSTPEDIKDNRLPPPEERISNYLDKLISWRPPCLFGIPPVSDDDDDDDDYRAPIALDILDDLDALAGIDTEDTCRMNEEIFDIPDILDVDIPDIPYIDETLPNLDLPNLDHNDSCISCLDDSLQLSTKLGVLQLNDSVLM